MVPTIIPLVSLVEATQLVGTLHCNTQTMIDHLAQLKYYIFRSQDIACVIYQPNILGIAGPR